MERLRPACARQPAGPGDSAAPACRSAWRPGARRKPRQDYRGRTRRCTPSTTTSGWRTIWCWPRLARSGRAPAAQRPLPSRLHVRRPGAEIWRARVRVSPAFIESARQLSPVGRGPDADCTCQRTDSHPAYDDGVLPETCTHRTIPRVLRLRALSFSGELAARVRAPALLLHHLCGPHSPNWSAE